MYSLLEYVTYWHYSKWQSNEPAHCQIDVQMSLYMMIFSWVWDYDNLKSHLLMLSSVHFLVFRNMSLMVGPLCTGLISTSLSHLGSRHRWTGSFGSGMITMLLHCSVVSSNPSGTIICCSYGLRNSFLNGCYSSYVTHLDGDWCAFAPILISNKMCPWSTHFLCTHCCIYCKTSVLFLHLPSFQLSCLDLQ